MPTAKITNEKLMESFGLLDITMKNAPKITAALLPTLVTADVDNMSYVCSFNTADWMSNPAGQVHGGISATIADNAMGCLCTLYNSLCFTPTVSMNMNYLCPIPACSTIFVEAKIDKLGHNIIYTSAKMWTAGNEENPCVTATGVFAASSRSFV